MFTNLLSANEYVKENTDFIDSIREARERLSPLKIGRFGQLQEWKEDLDDPRNPHRHVSHLYACFSPQIIFITRIIKVLPQVPAQPSGTIRRISPIITPAGSRITVSIVHRVHRPATGIKILFSRHPYRGHTTRGWRHCIFSMDVIC